MPTPQKAKSPEKARAALPAPKAPDRFAAVDRLTLARIQQRREAIAERRAKANPTAPAHDAPPAASPPAKEPEHAPPADAHASPPAAIEPAGPAAASHAAHKAHASTASHKKKK